MTESLELFRREPLVNQDGTLTWRFHEYLSTLLKDITNTENDVQIGNISTTDSEYFKIVKLLFGTPIVVDSKVTTFDSGLIVSDGFDITLNATPSDNERVYIKTKKPFFIKGNGKTIDGAPQIYTGLPFTTLLLAYILENDEWLII